MIISRTPYRISFLGGGTDYPAWYLKHGGAVLAVTIDKFCYLTVRYLPPFFEHRIRVVYSKIESCQSIEEIQHPAVRGTLQFLAFDRGVEIHHDGDLPARSGMESSSSFAVGLLHALHGLRGRMPTKAQLAREAIHVEQEVLQETVGSQDQVLAAFGGFSHISFLSYHGLAAGGILQPHRPQGTLRQVIGRPGSVQQGVQYLLHLVPLALVKERYQLFLEVAHGPLLHLSVAVSCL